MSPEPQAPPLPLPPSRPTPPPIPWFRLICLLLRDAKLQQRWRRCCCSAVSAPSFRGSSAAAFCELNEATFLFFAYCSESSAGIVLVLCSCCQ